MIDLTKYPTLHRIYKALDPPFIRGIAIGIILSLILAMTFQMGTVLVIANGLVIIVMLLIIGAILGNYFFNYQKQKVEKLLEEKFDELGGDIKITTRNITQAALSKNRAEELPAAIDSLKESQTLRETLKLGIGFLTRFFAFGTLLTVLGGVVSFAIFMATYMQVEHLERQNTLITKQNEKIDIQNSLSESSRRAGLVFELSSILEEIDEELDKIEDSIKKKGYFDINTIKEKINIEHIDTGGQIDYGYLLFDIKTKHFLDSLYLNISVFPDEEKFYIQPKLSDRLEGRIIAVSKALRPYKYLNEANNLNNIFLSPERGQLLISLIESNIFISQIIPKSEFSYADLRGINFIKNTQFDLVESEIIDMQDINLSNSDLTQTRFNLVYFGSALFDRATIQGTEFFGCFLFGASMQNTVVTKTSFKSCNLDGLDLQSSVVDSVEFIDCNLSLPFLQAAKFGQVTMKNSWLFAPERFSGIDSIKGKINIENCYTTLKDWPERLADSTSNKWQLDSVLVKQKTLTVDSLIYSYMLEVGVNSQKLDTIYTVSCVIKAN